MGGLDQKPPVRTGCPPLQVAQGSRTSFRQLCEKIQLCSAQSSRAYVMAQNSADSCKI